MPRDCNGSLIPVSNRVDTGLVGEQSIRLVTGDNCPCVYKFSRVFSFIFSTMSTTSDNTRTGAGQADQANPVDPAPGAQTAPEPTPPPKPAPKKPPPAEAAHSSSEPPSKLSVHVIEAAVRVIHLGDHTVKGDGAFEQPCHAWQTDSAPDNGDSLIRLAFCTIRNYSADLNLVNALVNRHLTVNSHLYRHDGSGAASAVMPVASNHAGASRSAKIAIYTNVEWTVPIFDSSLSLASLTPWLPSGKAGDANVGPGVAAYFGMSNADARLVWDIAEKGMDRWNTIGLYVKGLVQALSAEQYSVLAPGQPLIMGPAPPALPVNWIDTAAAAFNADDFRQRITRGDFMMVVGQDCQLTDVPYLNMLASAEQPVLPDIAQGTHNPATAWITFPAIPISVVAPGVAAPAAAAWPAFAPAAYIAFLRRLATRRGEEDIFAEAVQVAVFYLGGDMGLVRAGGIIPVAAAAAIPALNVRQADCVPGNFGGAMAGWAIERYRTPSFESAPRIYLPRPKDYNPLHRALRLTRVAREVPAHLDYEMFFSASPSDKYRMCAIIAAVTSVCTTTVLQSFNITGSDLDDALFAILPNADLLRGMLVDNGFLTADVDTPCGLWDLIDRLMVKAYGGRFHFNSGVVDRNWSAVGIDDPWQGGFLVTSPNRALNRGFVLSLAQYFSAYPQEWCILAPGVDYDFTKETVLGSNVLAQNGWFAWRGAKEAFESSAQSANGVFIPYGLAAINVIKQSCSALDPGNALTFSVNVIPRQFGDQPAIPDATPPVFPHAPVWHVPLRILEPCTLRTFDWQTNTTYAHAISANNVPAAHWARTISALKRENDYSVGVGTRSGANKVINPVAMLRLPPVLLKRAKRTSLSAGLPAAQDVSDSDGFLAKKGN